jgi:hypothetical protein
MTPLLVGSEISKTNHLNFQFFRDGIRNGDYFVGIIYLMETSTPFVSIRFILSKFKVSSSRFQSFPFYFL